MATPITKSIRASGGNYTTLTLFEDDLPASLITADEQWTAECYDDWAGGLDDAPQFLTHTCDATRYIEIKVASGSEHGGIPFGGFYIKEATSATFFFQVYQCDYFKITGIDLNVNIISSNSGFYIYDSDYAELDGNICNYTAVYGNMENYKLNASSNATIINNLSYTATTGNTYIGFDIDAEINAKVHNNTSVSARYGFYNGNGSGSVANNNVALDNSSKGFLAIGTNYSASEDNSAVGTGAITGIDSTEFEDAASDDYHLDSASQLIDAAENLYSTFTTDVDGDTRPSSGDWDIGFDHYAAASGTSVDLIAASLVITPSTMGVDAGGVAVDLIAASLAITSSVMDVEVGLDASLIAASLAITSSVMGVDLGDGATEVNLIPASLAISEATLGVEIGLDVTLLPASLAITPAIMDVEVGLDVTLIPASLAITPSVMDVETGVTDVEVDMIAATLAITSTVMDVDVPIVVSVDLIPASLVIDEAIMNVDVASPVNVYMLGASLILQERIMSVSTASTGWLTPSNSLDLNLGQVPDDIENPENLYRELLDIHDAIDKLALAITDLQN